MATELKRSFLLGRTMGDAVKAERELIVSELILQGLRYAPLAMRAGTIKEYLQLRDDMHRRRADGTKEPLALTIRRRIVDGLEKEEKHAS